jgi:hypothetical protein
MNELVAAAKGFGGRGYGYSKLKKTWTAAVCARAKAAGLGPVERAVLRFEWVEKAMRRDPDNIVAGKKLVLDGLVDAGVLRKDGWKSIAGFSDGWRVDYDPGVMVVIEAVSS